MFQSLRRLLAVFFVLALLVPGLVIAQTDAAPKKVTCADGTSGCIPLPPAVNVPSTDPLVIAGILIRSILLIIGSVTLLMFVWGGFLWLTSAGNEDRVEKGSSTMLWAAIGVFLVFASYLIINTYLNLLTGKG